MTTKEFSDAFDTLIASYNHKAEFGDLASYADVTLDEYEKSVFLTLAQDNIIKTYFDNRANSIAEGFDDSIRRQADFSSLVTVKLCTPYTGDSGSEATNWSLGKAIILGTTNTIQGTGGSYGGFELTIEFALVIDEGHPAVSAELKGGIYVYHIRIPSNLSPQAWFSAQKNTLNALPGGLTFLNDNPTGANYLGIMTSNTTITDSSVKIDIASFALGSTEAYDERGSLYMLPSNLLLMLNERVRASNGKYFVVVPISYKEYDRLMSRAYALPLKKQCWRLFEGNYADSTNQIIKAEIIPKEGILVLAYIIRYLRRPRPIILTDLDLVNSLEPLEIDGYDKVTECELNPILHMDILEEAVRLALNSKGIETRDLKAAREAARNSNRS